MEIVYSIIIGTLLTILFQLVMINVNLQKVIKTDAEERYKSIK